MAQIKIRIELNKGRMGAPLEKLGDISRQMEKFLRALTADLNLEVKKSEWLAVNFKNGSVSYDASFQHEVTDSTFRHFNRCIEFVTDFDPETDGSNGLVSDATLLEYGRLGEHIDPDEAIGIGLYTGGVRTPKKWRQVNYRKTSRVRDAMEMPIRSYGSIQGILHAWFKEAHNPYFQVREFATDQLVKCIYDQALYPTIVDAVKERSSVVYATGHLKLDRAKRAVDEMLVERIDRVEKISDDEFKSFFGIAPDITGKLTTDQFISNVRLDG